MTIKGRSNILTQYAIARIGTTIERVMNVNGRFIFNDFNAKLKSADWSFAKIHNLCMRELRKYVNVTITLVKTMSLDIIAPTSRILLRHS